MNKEHRENIIFTLLSVIFTLGLGSYTLIVHEQTVLSLIYMFFTNAILLFIFFNNRNHINKKNQ